MPYQAFKHSTKGNWLFPNSFILIMIMIMIICVIVYDSLLLYAC